MSETTAAESIVSPGWVQQQQRCLLQLLFVWYICRSVREGCLLIFFEVMVSQLALYKDEKYETLFFGQSISQGSTQWANSHNVFRYFLCQLPCVMQPPTTEHPLHLCGAERRILEDPGADGEVKGLAQWPTVRQMKMVKICFVVTVRVFKPVTSRSQTRLPLKWFSVS